MNSFFYHLKNIKNKITKLKILKKNWLKKPLKKTSNQRFFIETLQQKKNKMDGNVPQYKVWFF